MRLRTACLLSMLFMLFMVPAMAANLTGHWSGQVEISAPDGTVQTQAAFLDLKQEGDKVTGSGGTEPGESLPLENVQFDGNRLSFKVTGPDGREYKSNVTLADKDRLEGKLNFAMQDGTEVTCKLTLKREPAS